MDKVIQRTFWERYSKVILGIGVVVVLIIIYIVMVVGSGSSFSIEKEKVTISQVRSGSFQEFITVSGSAKPKRTVVLVTLAGGVVEEMYVEDGDSVSIGDSLMKLSNQDMILELMGRETALLDQLNNVRNGRLAIEQNHIGMKQELYQAERQFQTTKRVFDQNEKLHKDAVISENAYLESRDDFRLHSRNYNLLKRAVSNDSILMVNQLKQLNFSSNLIENNLNLVRQTLDNLLLRAPISGTLTNFIPEIGENLDKGQEIGQIDVAEGYKIQALIDEHYISRIQKGLQATINFGSNNFTLVVSKVYPRVEEGKFKVDLKFVGDVPKNIRQGQTFNLKLEIGETQTAIIVDRGGFFQSTGGNWAYVVVDNKAVKREISIGRQNPSFFEVLSGLAPGEMIITSNYDVLGEADSIELE